MERQEEETSFASNWFLMGLFSFLTHDTKISIPVVGSNRKPIKVHMIDDQGHIWTETNYEGYGIFGGKDIYEVIAEMNPKNIITELMVGREKRDIGIALHFGVNGVMNKKTREVFLFRIDFNNWNEVIEKVGKSPNDLLDEHSDLWLQITLNCNCRTPMLLEVPPSKNFFTFYELRSCEHQGFFYPDNEELWDQVYGKAK